MDLETQIILPMNYPELRDLTHEEIVDFLRPIIEQLEKEIAEEKAQSL